MHGESGANGQTAHGHVEQASPIRPDTVTTQREYLSLPTYHLIEQILNCRILYQIFNIHDKE